MKKVVLGVLFLGCMVVLGGCASHYRDTALFYRDGRAKPLVAVLPVINSAGAQKVAWDVCEELTEGLRHQITDSSKIYLVDTAASVRCAETLNAPRLEQFPAGIKEGLSPAEFVIVAELLNQQQMPYGLQKAPSKKAHLKQVGADLALSMRIRVIDLRGDAPTVVLQEVVTENYDVAKAYLHTDYKRMAWGTPAYKCTPMGMAHAKLISEVIAHAEGYIGVN